MATATQVAYPMIGKQPPYNVILVNDNDHSFPYVIGMLQQLFGHTRRKSELIAKEVHEQGRAILLTTTKEHAEFKQEQIHAYGPDPDIARCKGSMTCQIEPAY